MQEYFKWRIGKIDKTPLITKVQQKDGGVCLFATISGHGLESGQVVMITMIEYEKAIIFKFAGPTYGGEFDLILQNGQWTHSAYDSYTESLKTYIVDPVQMFDTFIDQQMQKFEMNSDF